MKAREWKVFLVRMQPDLYERVQRYAIRHELSMAQVVRHALRVFLDSIRDAK